MKASKDSRVKGIRLMAAAIILLFILFVVIRILFEESRQFSPLILKGNTIIFSLWILIILFGLTFLFILARNIIKMYFDRRRSQGMGLKNRLVFFFVAFSIVPTLLLFFFATDIISSSIEQWFKAPIDNIMQNVETVKDNYYNAITKELGHFSRLIADMITQKKMYTEENRTFLYNKLKEKMIEFKLDTINVYRNQNEIFAIFNPGIPMQEYKDLPLDFVYKGLGGAEFIKLDSLKNGELIRNGVPIDIEGGSKMLIVTGKYFPESYSESVGSLAFQVTKYTQMKALRDPVKNTYIFLFIFITILIIFAASWLGFYLAKGITTPIDKLVVAAAEIAKGNLDVRIDYLAKDEFNSLITEFNRMASDLKDNRDKLNRRTIELRHRRSIIETILKNITSGVIALNSRGEIIAINPEAIRMLSLESLDVLRQNFAQIISPNLYPDIHALITRALTSHFKMVEKEVDLKVKGKIFNLAVKITQLPNPVHNRFAGLLVVITDLSDLIKAQRMLVWREVAKRIAHEIKNPLTPIQISAQRILRSFEQPEEKFRVIVEDSLNVITQELDSIKNLAEEFANFARLPEVKFSQGDINQIIEKLVNVYTSIYQNVAFHVQLDPDLPPLVKLDVEQIKRVFVNIIDNGIEALGKKGEIEIVTRYNQDSKFITVEIADNGSGISDEDKQKLFIPYFSKTSTGTGLGLAIVHNIIEEHNGLISVVDNQPQGARFVIELPA